MSRVNSVTPDTLHYRAVLLFLRRNPTSNMIVAHENLSKTTFKSLKNLYFSGIFLKYLLLKLPFMGKFLQVTL